MPKPRAGEDKNHFISRCIAYMNEHGEAEGDQAVAICHSIWENKTAVAKTAEDLVYEVLSGSLDIQLQTLHMPNAMRLWGEIKENKIVDFASGTYVQAYWDVLKNRAIPYMATDFQASVETTTQGHFEELYLAGAASVGLTSKSVAYKSLRGNAASNVAHKLAVYTSKYAGAHFQRMIIPEVERVFKSLERETTVPWFKCCKAREEAVIARMDRVITGKSYWRTLSRSYGLRAYNFGALDGLKAQGDSLYMLKNPNDGATGAFCTHMHGRVFELKDGLNQMYILMSCGAGAERIVAGWVDKATEEEAATLSDKEMVKRGLGIPPFHAGCRTKIAKLE